MKIKSGLLALALIASAMLSAQSAYGQTQREITSSGDYYYGEGVGASASQADRRALSLISEQISVAVSSQITIKRESTKTGNNKRESVTSTDDLINTYSSATLTKCQKLVLANGPEEYRILRYVHKDEVDRAFEARENKVLEMLSIATEAEQEMKLDVALRHYYWAQLLVGTLLYPNELYFETEDGLREVAVWVPMRINEILDSIEFSFGGYTAEDKTLATLHITAGGRPVTSLEYSYWDGVDWSVLTQAKDGLGAIELRANTLVNSVNVKIEYAYDNEMHIDPDLRTISEYLNPISYKKAYKNSIPLKESAPAKQESKPKQAKKTAKKSTANGSTDRRVDDVVGAVTEKYESIGSLADGAKVDSFTLASVDDKKPYVGTVKRVVSAIERDDYDSVRQLFTADGYEIYSKLLKYGRARSLMGKEVDMESEMSVMEFEGNYYCRSIPMQFSFPGNKKFVENVVFEFDKEGKISSLQFGLERTTLKGITDKSRWSDGAKMVIINFLENYKTAFALTRLDYIGSLFSEEALIITGRVVKPTSIENQITLQNQQHIEYNRQTKSEYIGNLRRSFASKEYINLRFSTLQITKMNRGDGEVYFLEVKQDYYSSNYGDTGYLTLLFDVRDYRKPIIHARTWQPEPDPNFGLFSPGDF